MKENKSNKAETERRTAIVLEMLLTGYGRTKIHSTCNLPNGLNWNVTIGMIDQYIKKANKEIDIMAEKDYEKSYKKAKSRLLFLYQKLAEKKDYKAAILALKELAEIDGLKVQKVANVNPDGSKLDLSNLSKEEILAMGEIALKIGI